MYSKIKLLLLTLSLLFLCACSAHKQLSSKTEIEFWTLQLSSFEPYIQNVIKEFESKNPNVKIKWIDVPFSEGEKRALAAVMSKKVPDVINMNPSFASTLASRGALTDLNKYVNKKKYDTYLPESWQASTLGDLTFGVPWYITSAVTIYNKQILKKADIKEIPTDFDKLYNIASKVKTKTGKYVLMPNLTEDGYLLKIFNKYNIPIIDKYRSKPLFNTPKAAMKLQMMVNMYNQKLIPPESITQGHRASLEKYQAGETAIIVSGANFLKIIKENAPQIYKNTDVSPQLTGSNGKADFAIMNLVIPKRSKNKEMAVKFALFLTNTQNQLEFCKLAPILPSTNKGLESDLFKQNKKDLFSKARSISAKQLKNALSPIPPIEDQKDLVEIIDFATQSALLKEKSSKEALDYAEKEWIKILNKDYLK